MDHLFDFSNIRDRHHSSPTTRSERSSTFRNVEDNDGDYFDVEQQVFARGIGYVDKKKCHPQDPKSLPYFNYGGYHPMALSLEDNNNNELEHNNNNKNNNKNNESPFLINPNKRPSTSATILPSFAITKRDTTPSIAPCPPHSYDEENNMGGVVFHPFEECQVTAPATNTSLPTTTTTTTTSTKMAQKPNVRTTASITSSSGNSTTSPPVSFHHITYSTPTAAASSDAKQQHQHHIPIFRPFKKDQAVVRSMTPPPRPAPYFISSSLSSTSTSMAKTTTITSVDPCTSSSSSPLELTDSSTWSSPSSRSTHTFSSSTSSSSMMMMMMRGGDEEEDTYRRFLSSELLHRIHKLPPCRQEAIFQAILVKEDDVEHHRHQQQHQVENHGNLRPRCCTVVDHGHNTEEQQFLIVQQKLEEQENWEAFILLELAVWKMVSSLSHVPATTTTTMTSPLSWHCWFRTGWKANKSLVRQDPDISTIVELVRPFVGVVGGGGVIATE